MVVPILFSEEDIPEHKRRANWILDVDGNTSQYYTVDSKGQICQFKDNNQRSVKVGFLELHFCENLNIWSRHNSGCLVIINLFFLGISRFRPTLWLTRLKMSEIMLKGRKTQIKKKNTWKLVDSFSSPVKRLEQCKHNGET